ncbi:hypothetical protein [Bacillus altitudinis]|uniref:hypothetical protein n=1 Tax=Bacillus altitudinis TaxID=293387 RepID=UPI0012FEB0E1|nr:hypothetical protein [Bacillus altitudinis]
MFKSFFQSITDFLDRTVGVEEFFIFFMGLMFVLMIGVVIEIIAKKIIEQRKRKGGGK